MGISLGEPGLPVIFLNFRDEIVLKFLDISGDLMVDKIGFGLADGAKLFESFGEVILGVGDELVDFHLTSSEIKILNLLNYWGSKASIITFIETF